MTTTVNVSSTMTFYTKSGAKDRVITDIKLPEGTKGYAIRVTTSESGNGQSNSLSLLNAVQNLPIGPSAQLASKIASFAIEGDGAFCDVFSFTDEPNASMFRNKQEGWRACERFQQRYSLCAYKETCLDMVSIGLRNNNYIQDLKVSLEIVALVSGTDAEVYSEKPFLHEDAPGRDDVLVTLYGFDTSNNSAIISFCSEKINSGLEYPDLYISLGWSCLITKQFTKARYYLEQGAVKHPFSLYIQGNFAHSLLLTGDTVKAMEIYRKYLDENIAESVSWKQAVIQDITTFKQLGIQNSKFDEIFELMDLHVTNPNVQQVRNRAENR